MPIAARATGGRSPSTCRTPPITTSRTWTSPGGGRCTSTTCSSGRTPRGIRTTRIRTSARCSGRPSDDEPRREGASGVTELRQEVRGKDLAWWKERFGVRYPEAGPPFFKPRSNVYRRKSATIALPLPDDVAKEQPERQHELLLAATCGVLYRYAGGEEPEGIVVGSPLPAEDADEDEPGAPPLIVHLALPHPL